MATLKQIEEKIRKQFDKMPSIEDRIASRKWRLEMDKLQRLLNGKPLPKL